MAQNDLDRLSLPPADPAAVEQVRKWILQGASEADTAEAIGEKYPDAAARPLILAAVASITASADYDPAVVMGWSVEAIRYLYSRMVGVGDFAGALRAVKQLIDLARHPIDLDGPDLDGPDKETHEVPA